MTLPIQLNSLEGFYVLVPPDPNRAKAYKKGEILILFADFVNRAGRQGSFLFPELNACN
jgi:hypothetical protein